MSAAVVHPRCANIQNCLGPTLNNHSSALSNWIHCTDLTRTFLKSSRPDLALLISTRFSCKRMFLFFQTISAIINSMQQEKGHTNKEKLKSKFFAKRIWKIEYRLSCWEIFWFKIWPNKSAFLKLFCWSCFCVVLQLFWNSKFSLKKFPTLDRWW